MRIWSCASRTCALVIVACLFASSVGTTAVGQEVDTSTIMQGTNATPLDRKPPVYPRDAEIRGLEGWVLLSMVITKDGKIGDAVIEDSSGVREFERAALRAVKNWQYTPATWNGEPVEQCQALQKITFELRGPLGARRSYIRKARAAHNLVEEEKFDDAQKAVDAIFAEGELNLYETARLWLIQYQIDIGQGNERKALRSLDRVWLGDGDYVEKKMHDEILASLFLHQIRLQYYADALRTFRELKKTQGGLEGREHLLEAVDQVNKMRTNPQPFAVRALVENDCNCDYEAVSWDYNLLRKKFGIEEISGEISHIELWCSHKRFIDTSVLDRVWEIPDSWGQCRLQVHGDEGTAFKLVEYSS